MSPLVATRASASARAFGLMSASEAKAQYIAASSGSNIASSVDAVTWTQRYGPGWVIRNDAEHNGTMWVIVGNSGSIETSIDGISWTSRTSGTSQTLYSVNWLNSVWIVTGGNGYLSTSTDGITWTVRTTGSTDTLMDATYSGGTYVVSSTSGNILYGTTLSTWTLFTATSAGYVSSISTIGTLFMLCVGNYASGWVRVYTATVSASPTVWTSRTTPISAGGYGLYFGVVGGTARLITTAGGGTDSAYSTNGTSWTGASGWKTSYMVGYNSNTATWVGANLTDVQTATTLGTWTTRSLPFSNIYVAQGAK